MNELALGPPRQERGTRGLVSLWDMLEFNAHEFIEALRSFRAIETLVEQEVAGHEQVIVGDIQTRTITLLAILEQSCGALGAVITADFVRDAASALASGTMKWSDLAKATKLIYAVLTKELARSRLYSLSPHKIEYFDSSIERFELDVWVAFDSIQDDVDEAGKCFALGRHTACVFHLMRVLERPIITLGKILLPEDSNPNWETVLKKIDAELSRKPAERVFKGDVQFFAEVAAEMRAVKHAWRNRVMHVDAIVTEERAKAIFDATVSFMNAVSRHLGDDGLVDDPELGL